MPPTVEIPKHRQVPVVRDIEKISGTIGTSTKKIRAQDTVLRDADQYEYKMCPCRFAIAHRVIFPKRARACSLQPPVSSSVQVALHQAQLLAYGSTRHSRPTLICTLVLRNAAVVDRILGRRNKRRDCLVATRHTANTGHRTTGSSTSMNTRAPDSKGGGGSRGGGVDLSTNSLHQRRRRSAGEGFTFSMFAVASVTGLLLAGLGGHGGGWRNTASNCFVLASADMVAAEVQANGETVIVSNIGTGSSEGEADKTEEDPDRNKSAEAAPKRVSLGARARFPVTVVEEQPGRMVVIGDVHGDLGEAEFLLAGREMDVVGWRYWGCMLIGNAYSQAVDPPI